MQDGRKAVWSIPYVSVAFFPSLKQNFIAYRSSKVSSRPDCIFEIPQLWQLGFSRVYSNCFCGCSFEPEIIKIGQSSNKIYSNNILNFQESMTILNACTKKPGNFLKAPRTYMKDCWSTTHTRTHIHTHINICQCVRIIYLCDIICMCIIWHTWDICICVWYIYQHMCVCVCVCECVLWHLCVGLRV